MRLKKSYWTFVAIILLLTFIWNISNVFLTGNSKCLKEKTTTKEKTNPEADHIFEFIKTAFHSQFELTLGDCEENLQPILKNGSITHLYLKCSLNNVIYDENFTCFKKTFMNFIDINIVVQMIIGFFLLISILNDFNGFICAFISCFGFVFEIYLKFGVENYTILFCLFFLFLFSKNFLKVFEEVAKETMINKN